MAEPVIADILDTRAEHFKASVADSYPFAAKFTWQVVEQFGLLSTIEWKLYMVKHPNWYSSCHWKPDNPKVYLYILGEQRIVTFFPPEFNGYNTYISSTNFTKSEYLLDSGTIQIRRNETDNLGWLWAQIRFTGSIYQQYSSSSGTVTSRVYNYGSRAGGAGSGIWTGADVYKDWSVDTATQFAGGAFVTYVSPFTDETSPKFLYAYDRGHAVETSVIEACISFTGESADIPYREIYADADGEYTFDIADSERQQFWGLFSASTGKSVPIYIKIRTTETVGEDINIVESPPALTTLTIVNAEPVFEPRIYDTNEVTKLLTGNENHLIRYMSTAAFEINATPRKGGLDIVSQYIQNGDRIVENIAAGTFGTVTSNTFYLSATDDRLFTGTASYSLSDFFGEFINYIKLTNKATHKPITPAGEVEVTITGKYFNYNFGAAQNQISVQYMALLKGEESGSFSEPVVFTPTMVDSSTYSHTFIIPNLDYTKQYNITVRVNDLLMSQDSTFVAVSIPIFDWSRDDFAFYVPVTINGAEVPSIVQQGTSYPWTYRLWSDGVAECWTKVNFSTAATRTLGSFYTSGNLSATNIQYPFEFTENPVVIVSLGADNTYGAVMIAPGGSGTLSTFQQASTTQTGMYMIIASNETNSTSYTLNYYVKGRWK